MEVPVREKTLLTTGIASGRSNVVGRISSRCSPRCASGHLRGSDEGALGQRAGLQRRWGVGANRHRGTRGTLAPRQLGRQGWQLGPKPPIGHGVDPARKRAPAALGAHAHHLRRAYALAHLGMRPAPEAVQRDRQCDRRRRIVPPRRRLAWHDFHDRRTVLARIAAHRKHDQDRGLARRRRTSKLPQAPPVAVQPQKAPRWSRRRAAHHADCRAHLVDRRRALSPAIDRNVTPNHSGCVPCSSHLRRGTTGAVLVTPSSSPLLVDPISVPATP